MKKFLHFIISRVALKWPSDNGGYRHEETGLDWNEWVADSIGLYDKYCRQSLKYQACTDFILLSMFNEGIENTGTVLSNEKILYCKDINEVNAVAMSECSKYVNHYEKFLFTRIDRDDCLHNLFVYTLHEMVDRYEGIMPYYFDVGRIHISEPATGRCSIKDYYHTTSPFTSILQASTDLDLKIYKGHGRIKDRYPGIKNDNLEVLQIIHGKNLLNKIKGQPVANIDMRSFY